MEPRVSLVTLGVADVDRARRFSGALGWEGSLVEDDLADAMLATAAAAGATIGRTGAPTEWGGYSGVFLDPDGHPWEVAHNPHWRLDPDGTVHLPT